MVEWDPNAYGLVFFCGTGPAPFATLRYFSTSADAGNRFVRMRSRWGGVPAAKEAGVPPLPRITVDVVEDRCRTNVPTEEPDRNRQALSVEQTNASVRVYMAPGIRPGRLTRGMQTGYR